MAKRCDCSCYREDGCEILRIPDGIFEQICRTNQDVCVDKCIVPQIKALWGAGVVTEGCCCGHGKGIPEVIVSTVQNPGDAHAVLFEVDPERKWRVLQWNLVEMLPGDVVVKYEPNPDSIDALESEEGEGEHD